MNQITINGKKQHTVDRDSEGNLLVDGEVLQWDIYKVNDHLFHIIHQEESFITEILNLNHESKTASIKINGELVEIELKDKFDLLLEKLGMSQMTSKKELEVKAPMPGSILSVMVSDGDEVKKDQALLILEAMKMENVIKSPIDGQILKVMVSQGENVEKNHKMIEFKSE